MTTVAPEPLATDGSRERSAAHREARARAFEYVLALQTVDGPGREVVDEMIGVGEANGWPDVVRLGMLLDIICTRHREQRSASECATRLLEHAERDGDRVMTALALAVRAQERDCRAPVEADRDLARAVVLLEGHEGPSTEAVSAHVQCCVAAESRDLWELQLRHYDMAERCLDPDEDADGRRAVLLYNRAELQLNWVAALLELGAEAEMRDRAALARHALEAAEDPVMVDSWREDIAIFRDLLDAMSPPDGGAPPLTRAAEGEYGGYVHLARALRTDDLAQARADCDRAIARIDPEKSNRIYLFSLALAVELEAAQAGHETAGLRWGRELVARRWDQRLAALASMQSLIDVERLAAEHAELQQHAYVDDLTGLANRRALARFTHGLVARGASTGAIALVDLDHFKQINDGHGHAVGDAVLKRIALLLRAGVRDQDLVARLGGDEFLLLLAMPDRAAARRRCQAIMASIATCPWAEISPGLDVTASVGVAVGSVERFDELCARADAALYRAKEAGRNRLAD
ncbi:MAG TPA: GGDEF domain-containing protein [Solirubrobacteraceae bacterium]|nr:GGDEF domain-containing protein [Solirubrobacteraceae bacterium]